MKKMNLENIKTNFKKGWLYTLISVVIYSSIVIFIPIPGEWTFDIYLIFLDFALKGSLISIFAIILVYFFVSLILGNFSRELEKRVVGNSIKSVISIILGVVILVISSFIILGILFASAF